MTRTTDSGSNPIRRLALAGATALLAGSAGLVLATSAAAGDTGPGSTGGSVAPGSVGDCLQVTAASDGALTVVGRGFGAGERVTVELVDAGTATGSGSAAVRLVTTAGPDGAATATVVSPWADLILSAVAEPSGRGCAGRLANGAFTAVPVPTTTPVGTAPSAATAGATAATTSAVRTTPTEPSDALTGSGTSTDGAPATAAPATSPPTTTSPAPTAPASSTSAPATSAPATPTPTTPTPTTSEPAPQAHVLAAARAAELAAAAPATQPRPQAAAAVTTDVLPSPTYPQQTVDPAADGGSLDDGSTDDPYATTPTDDPFATETSGQAGAPVTFGQWSVPSFSSVSVTPYVAPSYDSATGTTTVGQAAGTLASTGVPVAALAVPGLLLAAGGAALLLIGRRTGMHGPGRRH